VVAETGTGIISTRCAADSSVACDTENAVLVLRTLPKGRQRNVVLS